MVERIDNALNITAEATVHIVLVCFLLGIVRAVVALIAIHKTVGAEGSRKLALECLLW